MKEESSTVTRTCECDVLVIGSGVSGYCAAIEAGRCGCETILIEKDEVLGGNSGPNLGVGITGADRYCPYGTETGVVHELHEEAGWCDAFTQITPGTMPYSISRRGEAVVQEFLEKANVRVLKRHYAKSPVMDGNRISGVIVEDLASFQTVRIEVRHSVIEASGDGEVGALAGADFDMGSEGKDEFQERSAPGERTNLIQGTSLVAIAQRTGREVVFRAPAGLPPFVPRAWQGQIRSFVHHHSGMLSDRKDLIFLYVTETGGHQDTIRDDGEIYEVLLKQLWAEWDHIKNGPHREEARCWDLLWVSPKAGKRESRRFLGDYVLTQTDVEEGRLFPDDITYGGHDLDDHAPFRDGGNIVAHSVPPLYGIPFRCCYSRNIDNLLLGGRLISATHLAHSTSRVMRTGGAIGQAVGLAAALCRQHACTPRDVHRDLMDELQQRLLLNDATILCRPLDPGGDLARSAEVTATSELRYRDQAPGRFVPLIAPGGNVLWDWPTELRSVELFLRNDGDAKEELVLTVYRAKRDPRWKTADEFHTWGRNDLRASAFEEIARTSAALPTGHEGWLPFDFEAPLRLTEKDAASDDDRLLIALERNENVNWALADRKWEIAELVDYSSDAAAWNGSGVMGTMRLDPPPRLGEAESVINGFHRRFSRGPTNLWMSDPGLGFPQELVLSWDEPQTICRVALTFDNLAASRHEYPWEHGGRVLGCLVKSYAVDTWQDGQWSEVFRDDCNYRRFRSHGIETTTTDRLRLRVLETHDPGHGARVYQVSVFGP